MNLIFAAGNAIFPAGNIASVADMLDFVPA
jgi:hypothetical protein